MQNPILSSIQNVTSVDDLPGHLIRARLVESFFECTLFVLTFKTKLCCIVSDYFRLV